MQDIKYLPGVGPKKAALFAAELGIHSVEDLLRHYPYKYVDRSRFYYIHEITGEMPYVKPVLSDISLLITSTKLI